MSCSEAKTRSIISNAWLLFFCFVVQVVTAASVDCFAQGAVDYTGNGGRHTIQGRIYFPSGRRADAPGLVVRLESLNSAPLSIFTDSSGSFAGRRHALPEVPSGLRLPWSPPGIARGSTGR